MLFELFITINLQIGLMSKNILSYHNLSKNKSALRKKLIKYPLFQKYNFMRIKH